MTSSGIELRIGNKYRVGRKIGSGSFGDIYLGKKSDLFVFCRFVFSHLSLLVDEVKLRNENASCDDDEKTPIASDARSEPREKRANTTLTNLSAPQERTFKRTRRLESNWYDFFVVAFFFFLSSFVSVLWAGIDFRRLVHVCSTRLRGRDGGRSARLVSRAGDRTSGEDFETLFLLTG